MIFKIINIIIAIIIMILIMMSTKMQIVPAVAKLY